MENCWQFLSLPYLRIAKRKKAKFCKSGNPQKAEEMYEEFIRVCKDKVPKVEHGVFGADMKVELLNDGPFTIVLDSKEL